MPREDAHPALESTEQPFDKTTGNSRQNGSTPQNSRSTSMKEAVCGTTGALFREVDRAAITLANMDLHHVAIPMDRIVPG